VRWVRWDDAGNVREVEPGSGRLPRPAMGRDWDPRPASSVL